MISFEECIRQEEHGLSDYLKERAQKPVKGCLQHLVIEQTASEYKAQQKKKKEEEWRKKALHGQFITRIEASEDTWGWLRRGKLKKETEGMILAAQDQALPFFFFFFLYTSQPSLRGLLARKVCVCM